MDANKPSPTHLNLFAYGTLIHPEIMQHVSGESPNGQPAILRDFERRMVSGQVYPAIYRKSGAVVEGILYQNLSARAFKRLDAFELAPYERTEVTVQCKDGITAQAYAYVYPPSHVSHLNDEDWNYQTFLKNGLSLFFGHYKGYDELG